MQAGQCAASAAIDVCSPPCWSWCSSHPAARTLASKRSRPARSRTSLRLRETTFARLEQLLDWCEAHGVRAVIDLQESIGGHNDYSGPARLYEDPAAQEATIALWRAIAARLRDRDSVAAYSLLAEPFGAPTVTAMVDMYDRLHDALRADGDDHILVIHDGFMGVGVLPVASEIGARVTRPVSAAPSVR